MLKVKSARTVGFVAAAALLLAGLALGLWPTGAVQAQDEEPPPVANLKCEARTDRVRFSWDIPQWSGGETKWYDVAVMLPNGNRFTERRHRDLRSRTYRGNWQPASEARIVVKALYDLPNGDRVTSAASEAQCVVPGTPNSAPAVSSAIADAVIVNESGTHEASLAGVFTDADNDALTITASSSDDTVATATVSADGSTLTVAAKSRGTATITVTAADGKGGAADDVFTVTVKAAPVVASAIADVSGLEVGSTRDVSLTGVFSDADGDALTITAASSDGAKATVSVAADYANLTVAGVAEGSATVTVMAQDSDGNTVSDAFDVTVPAAAVQLQQTQSSDATLSALTLTKFSGASDPTPAVALRPAFASGTTEYAAAAPAFTALVRVTATASDPGATIRVDGQAVASGAPSQQIRLEDNQPKKITVTVTAADGTTQQTYTVSATLDPRADLRDLTLSPGELHPSIFVTVQQDYRAWTPHGVASVRVTATRRHGVETLTVNGQAVTSGQASPDIDLDVGENRITVVATAPDGYTSKSYTITVTRLTEAESSDATLSGIMVYQATSFQPDNANNVPYEGDPLTITPAISRTEREYQAEQPEADGIYVAVAVTTNAPGARSIVINGPKVNVERRDPKDEVVSGETSGPWQMSLGYQLITIKVTSLDGKNTETYRLVIKRGTVDDLKGLRLSSGDGALTLSWEASDSPTAPTDYMLRWRRAGETAWLNTGFPAGWKTSYALDAGYAGPAEGDRFAAVSQGSATLSGLENGVAYEVQARGARGPLNPATGERQVFVFLRTDWQSLTGTPGAAKTTLTITPSSPSRQYGEADDLGYTVSGLKSGDAATDVLTGALSRASGEDAGDYAIGMGTLAVASAHAGKYALPAAPSVTTYTITPRPVTAISGVTVNARASDGTTAASFDTSAAAGTGVLPAELADFRAGGLAVSGVFPLAVPGTHDVSVTYSLQDNGTFKAANYSLSVTSATLRGELTAVAACAAGMMLFADGAPAEGGAPVTVTVGLSSPAGVGGASVTLTASGTATGDDYTLSSTTVAIAEGATAGAATITVIDDAVDDDYETIVLNAALAGSNLTAGPLTLTIADNDAPATPAPTPVADAGCVAVAYVRVSRGQLTVNLVATMDTKAAGYDDAVLRSMSLPQGVTIDSEFRSDVHSYRLTVPDDVDRLTFAGRFDRMKVPGSDEAWSLLVVEPEDLTQFEVFQSGRCYGPGTPNTLKIAHHYIRRATLTNLQYTVSPHTIALPPDAATVIKVAVYKTKIGDHYAFAPADAETQARKTVYTLTVTRGDPSSGDSSGGAAQSAPTVASPIADLTGLEVGATRDVSLSGVFSDADGDSLTVTAASSDEAKVTVTVAADYSKLTVTGVAVGTATITVTAQDADGNRVSDAFDAPVARKYNALIAQMYEWRNDPQWVSEKAHTDRWDRALLAFGETVADTSLTAMTASEAQQFADRGWERWAPVAKALREIEAGGSG